MADADEQDAVLLELFVLLLFRRRRRRKLACEKQQRRFWVRDVFLRRKRLGQYENLIREIRVTDREMYFR